MTTTITAKATLQLVTFSPERKVFVGQEATISCGSDSYPAKVVEIRTVRGGMFEVDLQEFRFVGDKSKPLTVGHQDWLIRWDQPKGSVTTIKLHKDGSIVKAGRSGYRFTLGVARPYYCWEF